MTTRKDSGPSVTFIFVVYHDYSALDSTLSKQVGSLRDGIDVVVVDNTPESSRNEAIRSSWSEFGIEVLTPAAGNVGYAGAADFMVRASSRGVGADFLCLCNSDIDLDLSGFADGLRAFEGDDGVGLIAPTLVNQSGHVVEQRHYAVPPRRMKLKVLSFIYSIYPLAVVHRVASDLLRHLRCARPKSRRVNGPNIFAPHGALIVVTSAYMRSTPGFSMPVFLFCEEFFMGYYCREAGLSCVVATTLQYSHLGHESMGSIPSPTISSHLAVSHRRAAGLFVSDPAASYGA